MRVRVRAVVPYAVVMRAALVPRVRASPGGVLSDSCKLHAERVFRSSSMRITPCPRPIRCAGSFVIITESNGNCCCANQRFMRPGRPRVRANASAESESGTRAWPIADGMLAAKAHSMAVLRDGRLR